MSRSYRKPYATWTAGGCSARVDKTIAKRGVRRRQKQALWDATDWDEFLMPHRYECRHNNVYSWRRDGVQRLQKLDHNYFNPYWMARYEFLILYPTSEKLIERMEERIERKIEWIERLSRK